jgi:hypothetical protein
MSSDRDPIRIANCSGFYGDRLAAAREMVEGGPIDALTGDWLAELTMLILAKDKLKDPARGFARTFLTQLEDVMGSCLDRGIRIVSNAGGLNPAGCASAIEELADRLGLHPSIAYVEGDDILDRLDEARESGVDLANLDTGEHLDDLGIQPITANAYLGGWGVVEGLRRGADIVVTGRVTDAAVVVGAAAWHHDWARTDWDALAGAVVAGHIIECGAQCTGGNFAFFQEVPGLEHPGFPIAEVAHDGSCVITKHAGTGGAVSIDTVTAQLLYEIQGLDYLNPDATVRLNSIWLEQEALDRVRVHGVRGLPGPEMAKVAINYLGGWRNSMTFVLTGLDIEAKADLAERTLWSLVPGGKRSFDNVDVRLRRTDRDDPRTNDDAMAELRVTVADRDREKVGRAFSNRVIEMVLANYPGFFTTSPPTDAVNFGVYWPTLVPASFLRHDVVVDGERVAIEPAPTTPTGDLDQRREVPVDQRARLEPTVSRHPETLSVLLEDIAKRRIDVVPDDTPEGTPLRTGGQLLNWDELATVRVPLGRIAGARSGDKGGNANIGVWARDDEAYDWLSWFLTTERLRELMPDETHDLDVARYDLPNLRAVNFVIVGLLGRGVAASTRTDPQAKGLGEYLRAKHVDAPEVLLLATSPASTDGTWTGAS